MNEYSLRIGNTEISGRWTDEDGSPAVMTQAERLRAIADELVCDDERTEGA